MAGIWPNRRAGSLMVFRTPGRSSRLLVHGVSSVPCCPRGRPQFFALLQSASASPSATAIPPCSSQYFRAIRLFHQLPLTKFMAKEVTGIIRLQIPAGQANPAPPVGPALGQQGVNIMAFCKEFNAATQKQAGDVLPVVITVYKDKTFTFITKSPPAAVLLKKAANIASGSKEPNRTKVGKVTRKQVMDIVKIKRKDLNAKSDEAAFRVIAGTARQAGIEIID